jgi:hypothetical protein
MEKHSLDRGQVRQLAEHVRLREVNLAQLREMLEEGLISNEQFQRLRRIAGAAATRTIRRTRALSWHLAKLTFRLIVFGIMLYVYLTRYEVLEGFLTQPFYARFTPLHVVWLLFMGVMVAHLVPNNRLTMAWRKARESAFEPVEGYDRLELLDFVQDQNIKAWNVMLIWLIFNAIWGILYLVDVLRAGDLLMLTVFYFLSDYLCILLFCPFQTAIMHNKCCINCRIYDWGHFMMFTPMLFIKNFFSWSLFFTSAVVLIHWERAYAKHPERFWEGSNRTLQCAHCKEQTCQIKKRLRPPRES